jgi:hypothetical protein
MILRCISERMQMKTIRRRPAVFDVLRKADWRVAEKQIGPTR